MKLFGHAATQSLTVTIDGKAEGGVDRHGNPVVRPGDAIQAAIRIAGNPDDKTRQALARLVCTHHWASEIHNDDTHHVTVTWHDDEEVADEHELVPGGAAVPEGVYPVTFTLPADATPSSSNAVKWSVQGVLKRRMGKDVTGEGSFSVPTPEHLHAGVAHETGIAQHNRAFEIEAPVRTAQPGGALTGTVVVRPTKDVSYEKLVVMLQMVRVDRRHRIEDRKTVVRVGLEIVLAEQLSVPAGVVKEFPFSVQLPDDASPTTYGLHTVKNWWLVASGVTKLLHNDQIFQLELNVYDDPA